MCVNDQNDTSPYVKARFVTPVRRTIRNMCQKATKTDMTRRNVVMGTVIPFLVHRDASARAILLDSEGLALKSATSEIFLCASRLGKRMERLELGSFAYYTPIVWQKSRTYMWSELRAAIASSPSLPIQCEQRIELEMQAWVVGK